MKPPDVALDKAQAMWPAIRDEVLSDGAAQSFKAGSLWCVLDGSPHVVSADLQHTVHFGKSGERISPQGGHSSPQAEKEWIGLDLSKEPVAVVFRKPENEPAYALLPELPGNSDPKSCTVFDYDAGHSSGNYEVCMAETRPAKPAEYTRVAVAMQRYGYNVAVHDRATPEMHARRDAENDKMRSPATPLPESDAPPLSVSENVPLPTH